MKIEVIAKVCHEANRAYCAALGDGTQLPWEQAPAWQRESAIKGVMHHLANPDSTPADSHEAWLKEKRETGWKYGPTKDPEKKEHPCFVPYHELPDSQKAKDFIFLSIVRALQEESPQLYRIQPGGRAEPILPVTASSVDEVIATAKKMFEAYNNFGPNAGKTWDGKPVPPWEDLGTSVQEKWIAAARTVVA